jgi:ABC-type glycerol-3-phosphate transport system substrate-binding protein
MNNHHSRRTVLKLLGATAALSPLLSACGGDDKNAAVTQGDVNLAFWTGDPGYSTFFKQAAARQTGKFRYSLTSTDYSAADLVTKLISASSSKQPTPDLAGLEISQFARLMTNNIAQSLLVDLTPAVDAVRNDFVAARLAPYSVDGKVYGVESANPLCVYYHRADLFAQHKVPDFPTWEEFAEYGAGFRSRTGISLVPISNGPDNGGITGSYIQFLLQRGGKLFDDEGKIALDSPEAVDVLTFIRDGLASGFMLGLSNFYGGPIQAAFKSGKLIGAAMPDWYNKYGIQATVPEQKGKWMIKPLPKFSGGGFPTSVQGGTGFAVLKNKANSVAAEDLLKAAYLTTEGQVEKFKTLGYLPVLKSAYADATLMDTVDAFLSGQKTFHVYAPLADQAPTYFQSPNFSLLVDSLGGPLLKAYKGQLEPQAAIKQAVDAYNRGL